MNPTATALRWMFPLQLPRQLSRANQAIVNAPAVAAAPALAFSQTYLATLKTLLPR